MSILTPNRTKTELLSPDAAEGLLQHLTASKWSRLQSEYDDPLSMLMDRGAKQWTLGWVPGGNTLFLLVWETDSFKNNAWWRLYENGTLCFEEMDGVSKARSALFETLLESEKLPFIEARQCFEPLFQYSYPLPMREIAIQNILKTLFARPETFNFLKESFFQLLEQDLGNPEWPTLEVMKIHRLSHKNALTSLFQHLVQSGFIRTVQDNVRLDRALSLLQDDYLYFGYKVLPIFKVAYDNAQSEFRNLLLDGTWRMRLKLKAPQH